MILRVSFSFFLEGVAAVLEGSELRRLEGKVSLLGLAETMEVLLPSLKVFTDCLLTIRTGGEGREGRGGGVGGGVVEREREGIFLGLVGIWVREGFRGGGFGGGGVSSVRRGGSWTRGPSHQVGSMVPAAP